MWYKLSDIDHLELLLGYRTVHPYIKHRGRSQNQSRRNRKRVGFLHGNASIQRGRAGKTGKTGGASAVRDRDRDRDRSCASGKKHPDNRTELSLVTRASAGAVARPPSIDVCPSCTSRSGSESLRGELAVCNPIKKARTLRAWRNGNPFSLRKRASSFPWGSAIEMGGGGGGRDSGTEFVIPFDTFRDIKRVISLLLHARVGYFRIARSFLWQYDPCNAAAQHVIGKSPLLYICGGLFYLDFYYIYTYIYVYFHLARNRKSLSNACAFF